MVKLQVDFSTWVRPVNQLNGTNNGPLLTYQDATEAFRDMGIDFVRFHENHGPNAKSLEIPYIFRNFDADEEDPGNYGFGETDAVVKAAAEEGMEILYRLGMSTEMEGTGPKILGIVPPDFEKWARIAEHIIRHYNEGWAEGFHYGIRYWEIWNEPDLRGYWPDHTHSDYIRFYGVVARHLKKCFPYILVGPGGFAGLAKREQTEENRRYMAETGLDSEALLQKMEAEAKLLSPLAQRGDRMLDLFLHSFLQKVAAGEMPMDFFAWHFYLDNSKAIKERTIRSRELLRAHGLEGKVENINTEWEAISLKRSKTATAEQKRWCEGWELWQVRTPKSMACVLAAMLVMQNEGIDKANYYDADTREPIGGLYEFDGTPLGHYYAMKAFRKLREAEYEYATFGETDTVRLAAAKNEEKAVVVITNEDEAQEVELHIDQSVPGCLHYYLLEGRGPIRLVKKEQSGRSLVRLSMEPDTAYILEWKEENPGEVVDAPVYRAVSLRKEGVEKWITVDFTERDGTIRPQHGVCNYPVALSASMDSLDRVTGEAAQRLLQEAAFPAVRITEQIHRGYGKSIDIPAVFRDFSKDPENPLNYYFYNTDCAVSETVKAVGPGGKILYRLGAPREIWAPSFNRKPENYDTFATVCRNVVRHLNEGWGDGIHAGIEYWEIWNRADDPYYWTGGTWEDYYRLYETAARKIKNACPHLKVGGPSAAGPGGDNRFLAGFLAYVKEHEVPIDFVSWSYFGEAVKEAAAQAAAVRALVGQSGIGSVELVNTMWNCMTVGRDGYFQVPHVRDMAGAAFAAGFLMEMQRAGMDFCTYYDCQRNVPWGGLVSQSWTAPQKPLYSFVAFAKLYRARTACPVKVRGDSVSALAAKGEKEAYLLVSAYENERSTLVLEVPLEGEKTVYLLDEAHGLEPVQRTLADRISLVTEGPTVVLVEWKPA